MGLVNFVIMLIVGFFFFWFIVTLVLMAARKNERDGRVFPKDVMSSITGTAAWIAVVLAILAALRMYG